MPPVNERSHHEFEDDDIQIAQTESLLPDHRVEYRQLLEQTPTVEVSATTDDLKTLC